MELNDAVEILGDVARGAWNSRQDEAARVALAALDYARRDAESLRPAATRAWEMAALLDVAQTRTDLAQTALNEWSREGLDARAVCARIDIALNSPLDHLTDHAVR